MPLRDLFITAFIFGMLPIALKHPHIGILLWSWISYMNPHRLTWSFAFDFPFAQVIAIVLFLSLLISKEPKKIPFTPLVMVWLIFILVMGLSTLFAVHPEAALNQYIKVIKIQLITFITLMVMGSKERINWLIWVIVLSIGFYGVKGGIYTVSKGGVGRVWGPPGGFIQGNNELALALLMVIPLMYYLYLQSSKYWIRWGLLGSIGLCGLSVAGSQSRGAFLAGFCMLIFFWLKGRKKLLLGTFIVVGTLALLAFMPESWHERMESSQDYQQDGSAMGRLNSWQMAFNMATDRLFAGGFENWGGLVFALYAPNPTDVHDAHSIYFEVLGEHGFIGLALFLLLGVMSWSVARWLLKNTPDQAEWNWVRDLSRMIQVSLIAYASGGAFLGLAYFDLYYHLIAILVLLQILVRRELAEAAEDALHTRLPRRKPYLAPRDGAVEPSVKPTAGSLQRRKR